MAAGSESIHPFRKSGRGLPHSKNWRPRHGPAIRASASWSAVPRSKRHRFGVGPAPEDPAAVGLGREGLPQAQSRGRELGDRVEPAQSLGLGLRRRSMAQSLR